MSIPKVSVVIPVYNAEPYIEKCVRSLFDQTLDELEFIFVDDCTPDNSIEVMERVLEEYPKRQPQVKVIRHEANQGVGQTRQDGIDAATGKYIIHCDPDDWVDITYYEDLLNIAEECQADIAIANYKEESTNYTKEIIAPIIDSKEIIFKSVVNHSFHSGFWNKLIISRLAQSLRIPEGVNVWEDLCTITIHLLRAKHIVYSNKGFYHYRIDNPNSELHKDLSKQSNSKLKAVDSLSRNILNDKGILSQININDLYLFQWYAKKFLLDNPTTENLIVWQQNLTSYNGNFLSANIPIKYKIISWIVLNGYFKLYRTIKRLI